MVGFIERKFSRSAIWCRRLALFALMYFPVTIIMHRLEFITTNQAVGLLAFGFVILIMSVLLAIHAIMQLWSDGAKGGKAMIVGLFLSIAMLTPFLVYAFQATLFPAINDISTNVISPPPFSDRTVALRRAMLVPAENDVNEEFSEDEINAILLAYPKIAPRRYPAGRERVYQAVREIISARGWKITDIRGIDDANSEKPPVATSAEDKDHADADSAKKDNKQQENANTENQATDADNNAIQDILLDAVAPTRIFSFKNDVVVMIVSEEENTLVDMRSAARWGVHDFGENAALIEQFMFDLDQNMLGIAGEG